MPESRSSDHVYRCCANIIVYWVIVFAELAKSLRSDCFRIYPKALDRILQRMFLITQNRRYGLFNGMLV